MVCPTCQGGLEIPSESGNHQSSPLQLKSRTPPPQHEPLYPEPATLDVWTEEAWNRHVANFDGRRRPGSKMATAFTFVGTLIALGFVGFLLSSPPGLRVENTPEAVARAFVEANQQGDQARKFALLTERARRNGRDVGGPPRYMPEVSFEVVQVGKDDRDRTYALVRYELKQVPKGMPKETSEAALRQMFKPTFLALLMRQDMGRWRIYAFAFVSEAAEQKKHDADWVYDLENGFRGAFTPFRLPKSAE